MIRTNDSRNSLDVYNVRLSLISDSTGKKVNTHFISDHSSSGGSTDGSFPLNFLISWWVICLVLCRHLSSRYALATVSVATIMDQIPTMASLFDFFLPFSFFHYGINNVHHFQGQSDGHERAIKWGIWPAMGGFEPIEYQTERHLTIIAWT